MTAQNLKKNPEVWTILWVWTYVFPSIQSQIFISEMCIIVQWKCTEGADSQGAGSTLRKTLQLHLKTQTDQLTFPMQW